MTNIFRTVRNRACLVVAAASIGSLAAIGGVAPDADAAYVPAVAAGPSACGTFVSPFPGFVIEASNIPEDTVCIEDLWISTPGSPGSNAWIDLHGHGETTITGQPAICKGNIARGSSKITYVVGADHAVTTIGSGLKVVTNNPVVYAAVNVGCLVDTGSDQFEINRPHIGTGSTWTATGYSGPSPTTP